MKKIFPYILILSFFGTILFPQLIFSADKKIGESCGINSDCFSGDCESSDLELPNDSFCVCDEPSDCSASDEYGGSPSDWECSDADEDVYYGLHYCQNKQTQKIEDPLQKNIDAQVQTAIKKFGKPGVLEAVMDTDASVQKFQNEIAQILQKPQPKINIPGLNFSDINVEEMVTTDSDGTTWLNIPFLGEYLSAVYKYAVIIVGLIAVIGLIHGGVVWTISGSTSEGKQAAQKRIMGSVIGVVIVSTSYILLYTINPELVQFRNLRVQYIKEIPTEDVVGDLTQDLGDYEMNAIPTGPVNSKIPYFTQRGNSTPFGACGTISTSGCGPTSLAMVVKKFGYTVNPADMAKEWVQLEYRKCPTPPPTDKSCTGCGNFGHQNMFADEKFLNKYNLKSEYLGKNKEKILQAIQQGKPVIASMGKSVFTSGAHFVVLAGINADGSIIVNDPNLQNYCNNGATKCDANLKTISSSAVPQQIVFSALKNATSFSQK